MNTPDDWDPRSPEVLANPIAAYDTMRHRCPVAYSGYLHHSVFRHADVMRIIMDPDTFSSQASSHVSVPNSMDPPEHTVYRALIDPYFSASRMKEFEPACRRICRKLVAGLPREASIEIMFGLAYPFAVQAQCAFMGWPPDLHEPLLQWIGKRNVATLSGERHTITAVATEFDSTIRDLLREHRMTADPDADDVTSRLMRETVRGRALDEAEIVSILRNWTVGELGTIAAGVGIIAHYLARNPGLQTRLRLQPELIRPANDEILRIHAPLVSNRRSPKCPVRLGDREIDAGERLTLIWASANRDEAVFGDPDEFRLDRDPDLNLLYGAGIHACPGAPLARLELGAIIQALLADTRQLMPAERDSPVPANYPASGFRQLFLRLK